MNIQLRLTKEIGQLPVEYMNLSGKATNLLKRLGCMTIEDVVGCWNEFDHKKGIGTGTKLKIQNGVVNTMIQKLPDSELIEWLNYLLDNNEAEVLKKFLKGFEEELAKRVA